jgi:hypothetical protein
LDRALGERDFQNPRTNFRVGSVNQVEGWHLDKKPVLATPT